MDEPTLRIFIFNETKFEFSVYDGFKWKPLKANQSDFVMLKGARNIVMIDRKDHNMQYLFWFPEVFVAGNIKLSQYYPGLSKPIESEFNNHSGSVSFTISEDGVGKVKSI